MGAEERPNQSKPHRSWRAPLSVNNARELRSAPTNQNLTRAGEPSISQQRMGAEERPNQSKPHRSWRAPLSVNNARELRSAPTKSIPHRSWRAPLSFNNA
ncbi:unnamed protein product [Linum trigynum]|uniref:Uncharacterized protein n=1 Tax=Linum trigynum TaxID=586398 RepID=A0AAV2DXF2_9ROSI